MNATTVLIDQKEEEILSFEVSDEVLESAAATEMAITFALCTGFLVCPIFGPGSQQVNRNPSCQPWEGTRTVLLWLSPTCTPHNLDGPSSSALETKRRPD